MINRKRPSQKTTIILTSVAVVCLFIILPVIIFLINSTKTATLKTVIAPSFTTLTIDGKKYPINTEIKFVPAKVTATLSADGFQPQEVELDLQEHNTTTLAIYLTPDDGKLDWYYQNSAEQRLLSAVTDTQANQTAEAYRKQYPITSFLPISVVEVDDQTYSMKEYRIDVGEFSDCKTDFCLKITDRTGGNQTAALDQIRSKGFNPDDYEIIYKYEPYFTGPPPAPTNP